MYIQAPEQKCCWLQAKTHTEKHGAICPTLAQLPTCIFAVPPTQPGRAPFLTASTSSTCSAGQTRGLNSLCHSANLLGSWSAMPLDPCASVQRHLSTRADWQRLTRRSGPGATAQTKLVRLGRGPLVLNPSVGRRFSVPRSVTVSVGEVGVFGVVACYTAMLLFLPAVRVGIKGCRCITRTCITAAEPPSIHPSLLCVSVRDHASRERGE